MLWRKALLIFNFSFNPPLPPVALLDVDSSSSDLIGRCHGDGVGEGATGGSVWGGWESGEGEDESLSLSLSPDDEDEDD